MIPNFKGTKANQEMLARAQENMRRACLVPLASFAIKHKLGNAGMGIREAMKLASTADSIEEAAQAMSKAGNGLEIPEKIAGILGELIEARKKNIISIITGEGRSATIIILPEQQWGDTEAGASLVARHCIAPEKRIANFKKEPLAEGIGEPCTEKPEDEPTEKEQPAKAESELGKLRVLSENMDAHGIAYFYVVSNFKEEFHEAAAKWCMEKMEQGMPPETIARILEHADENAPKKFKPG